MLEGGFLVIATTMSMVDNEKTMKEKQLNTKNELKDILLLDIVSY